MAPFGHPSMSWRALMSMDQMQNRHEWLIDEAGHLWPAGLSALREKIGSDLPWIFLKRYAVENVGYCSVALRSNGAQISLRPQIVTQATLAAAIYWLIEQRAPRLVISICKETWTHRLFASNWSALSYLSAEADAQLVARRSDFLSRRRSLDGLPRFHPLADLLRHAREKNHVYSVEAFERLAAGPLRRRTIVLAPSDDATRLTIREWGSGYLTYGKSWLRIAKGLNMEDQRDFAYACKAAASYRAVCMERESVLEDVDARVLDDAGKLNHVCYTRIIIPMADAAGEPVLVGASVVNAAADIRSKRIQEP
jgi:hypothetical protein